MGKIIQKSRFILVVLTCITLGACSGNAVKSSVEKTKVATDSEENETMNQEVEKQLKEVDKKWEKLKKKEKEIDEREKELASRETEIKKREDEISTEMSMKEYEDDIMYITNMTRDMIRIIPEYIDDVEYDDSYLDNEEWLDGFLSNVDSLQETIEMIDDLKPPAVYQEVNEKMLIARENYQAVVDHVYDGVKNGSAIFKDAISIEVGIADEALLEANLLMPNPIYRD